MEYTIYSQKAFKTYINSNDDHLKETIKATCKENTCTVRRISYHYDYSGKLKKVLKVAKTKKNNLFEFLKTLETFDNSKNHFTSYKDLSKFVKEFLF